jgi:tetratricopeptide (TPR) repeat protein
MKLVDAGDDNWIFHDDGPRILADVAFDEAMQCWYDREYDLCESLFKSVLTEDPYHIDALHHLSLLFDETSREFEAFLCCKEAARLGLDAIPEEFSWKHSQLEWFFHENRPFLRAYYNLGLWHHRRDERDKAIAVFSRLLAVCSNDNLGVRYLLPQLWLEKGDILSVIRLCKQYEDDCGPEIMYTYALAYILSGETTKARLLLKKAKTELPLVAKELKKKRHTKPKSFVDENVMHGGADQAYVYWLAYGKFWINSEQGMALLSEK